MKVLWVSLFLTLGMSSLFAQRGRILIDHRTTAKSAKDSLSELAQRITQYEHSASDKVTALAQWLINEFSYDMELRMNPELQKEIFRSRTKVMRRALAKRKAVCASDAYLFETFCKALGIEAVTIHGFTKKIRPTSEIRQQVHHSWNAVFIRNQWYLLDITWARSHQSTDSEEWIFVTPERFIKTHYPQDKKWTLLANPLPFAAFEGVL